MWHLQAASALLSVNGVEVTAAPFNRRLGISAAVQRELMLRRRTDRTREEGREGED